MNEAQAKRRRPKGGSYAQSDLLVVRIDGLVGAHLTQCLIGISQRPGGA